jgi:hypothetical protein
VSSEGPRTGATRDVPPPRPVPASSALVEETGLGRAARAVADAVAGLVGGRADEQADGTRQGPSAAAAGLRDVVGAVAGAVGAAFSRGEPATAAHDEDPVTGERSRTPGALLGDLLTAVAPRLPIRDAARLRAAYPGLSDAAIADVLVARAARLTSAVGAATGGLTAASWLAPPSLVTLPLQMGAETVLSGGVELVLVGELHELYGRRPDGDARARAAAYLSSWSAQRSVEGTAGLGSVMTAAGVQMLRRQVTRRVARGIPVAAPFLIGAAIVARSNRRATESLARNVLADLRALRPLGDPGGGRV